MDRDITTAIKEKNEIFTIIIDGKEYYIRVNNISNIFVDVNLDSSFPPGYWDIVLYI